MDINNQKWFRSLGAEKLMEAEEREKKEGEEKDMKDDGMIILTNLPYLADDSEKIEESVRSFFDGQKNTLLLPEFVKGFVRYDKAGSETGENPEAKEATVLEAVPSDMVVVDKKTGEKMILLNFTATDQEDYYIAVNKDSALSSGRKCDITVLLTDEQKKLLEE